MFRRADATPSFQAAYEAERQHAADKAAAPNPAESSCDPQPPVGVDDPEAGVKGERELGRLCAGCGEPSDLEECAACLERLVREQVESLWRQGISIEDVAERQGVPRNTMRARLAEMRKAGWDLPRRPRRAPQRNRVLGLLAAGLTPGEIGEKLGMNPSTVSTTVSEARKRGIEIPHQGQLRKQQRRSQILRLWNEGLSATQIADRLGSTRHAIHSQVLLMRRDGWDVPRRCGGSIQ